MKVWCLSMMPRMPWLQHYSLAEKHQYLVCFCAEEHYSVDYEERFVPGCSFLIQMRIWFECILHSVLLPESLTNQHPTQYIRVCTETPGCCQSIKQPTEKGGEGGMCSYFLFLGRADSKKDLLSSGVSPKPEGLIHLSFQSGHNTFAIHFKREWKN